MSGCPALLCTPAALSRSCECSALIATVHDLKMKGCRSEGPVEWVTLGRALGDSGRSGKDGGRQQWGTVRVGWQKRQSGKGWAIWAGKNERQGRRRPCPAAAIRKGDARCDVLLGRVTAPPRSASGAPPRWSGCGGRPCYRTPGSTPGSRCSARTREGQGVGMQLGGAAQRPSAAVRHAAACSTAAWNPSLASRRPPRAAWPALTP